VELAQTVPLRVLDEKERGIGHVDAHFDHGGGDQDPHLPPDEALHDRVLVRRRKLPVQERHLESRNSARAARAAAMVTAALSSDRPVSSTRG